MTAGNASVWRVVRGVEDWHHEHVGPFPRRVATVSSSLVLAVNSDTLSEGLYDSIPAIFLKSLTA